MVFSIVGGVIGLAILAGGIYYLVRDGKDAESKKISAVTIAVGALILVGAIVKGLL